MFIDFEKIEEDLHTQDPTPSYRRQDHDPPTGDKIMKIIPQIQSAHICTEKTFQPSIDVNLYVLTHLI